MNQFQINKILVPIDFSEVSLNALETAISICRRQFATLTLIHVVENNYSMTPPGAGGAFATVVPEMILSANQNLSELAKTIRTKHDIVVNHIVQAGSPSGQICTWAEEADTDLIVMGTHGASGMKEFFMGTNAYSVVKNAPCPAMTIPGNNRWTDFKKILFPIRVTPNALDKYDIVRPIIKRNGASLQIAGIVGKEDHRHTSDMKDVVDTVRNKVAEDDVICGSELHLCDDVADQVIRLSEESKPDLVVITASIDSLLKEFTLGAYTQRIVNHAKFPVLSIRPDLTGSGKLGELKTLSVL